MNDSPYALAQIALNSAPRRVFDLVRLLPIGVICYFEKLQGLATARDESQCT